MPDPISRLQLGITNAGWGVCGFTSCFYAMWALNKTTRSSLINASKPFNVLAEIKSYLRMLQAEGGASLSTIKDIEAFTQSFGGKFASFTVDNYIAKINGAVSLKDKEIMADEGFGIAMPPLAVVDYLKRMWDYTDGQVSAPNAFDGGGDAIIGMSENKMKLYGGLCHYMYRYDGLIYSWGKKFNTIQEAADGGNGGDPWYVRWTISLKARK